MADSEKHPIRNGIIITVSAAAICYGATYIPGLTRWVATQAVVVWEYFSNSTTIPRWLLALLGLCSFPLLLQIIRSLFRKRGPNKGDFREQTFFGVVWRWDYSFGEQPINIWCFCPRCDTRLVYNESFYPEARVSFECEHCCQTLHIEKGDKKYALSRVARQIERCLKNESWLDAVRKEEKSVK